MKHTIKRIEKHQVYNILQIDIKELELHKLPLLNLQNLHCRSRLHRLKLSTQAQLFWTPGLPNGVHSNRPCPLVRPSVSQSLNISETAHWFFLIFCMKLVHHKGTKVTEPDF